MVKDEQTRVRKRTLRGMVELHLPIVHPTDRLRDVLRRMREMNVSGAVCKEDKNHSLLHVREVIFALHENPESTVEAITNVMPLDRSSEVCLTGQIGKRVKVPILDKVAGIGVSRTSGRTLSHGEEHAVFVQVYSASLKRELTSSPRDCFCNKNWERVTGHKDGDECPNADGGTVCCG